MTHRHLPLPTRALYKIWSWTGRPRVDRFLGGVDIFHATNYFLPPVQKARRVVTFHDLAFLRNPEWCSPKIVGPFSRGMKRFAAEADAIIACSAATARDSVELLGADPARIHVVHEAVDEHFVPISRPTAVDFLVKHYDLQQPFLLFVSTLEPRKNIAALLEAFALVKDDIPHNLVLVGSTGWCMSGLDEQTQKLDLETRVRRIGYVERHTDLANFYSAADAFLFPSLYEGFGLPVLEAMTCGCPVITSDVAALPEVGGDAAHYVNPEDIDGLATAIRTVLLNERLRTMMSEKGILQAGTFSWRRCAQETLDVYRSLF
jgi:glycosyltransferase involved in cell wall biosynthesis